MRPARAFPFLVLAFLILPIVANAQTASGHLWVTDGPVYTTTRVDKTIYLGGFFNELSAPTGGGVLVDSLTGFASPNFPKVAGTINVVVSDGAGGWYVGGNFTHVGGLARANLAHIQSNLAVDAWNPNPNSTVAALNRSFVGTLFVGGLFTQIGGAFRSRLAEINAAGNATAWNPSADGTVGGMERVDNSLYISGSFPSVAGQPRHGLAAVNINTGTLDTWNPNPNGFCGALKLVRRPNFVEIVTTFFVAGNFTTIGGQARTGLAEIGLDGVATAWNPNLVGTVYVIEEFGGPIYIGGSFSSAGGATRSNVAALDYTTAAATAWNPNANNTVLSITSTPSGIILGGIFATLGGTSRRNLGRVHATTGVADAWNPRPNGGVIDVVAGTGPYLFVSGAMTGFTGVTRHNLAALDATTGAPTSWDPDMSGAVSALAFRTVGPHLYTIFAGGSFQFVGGVFRNKLAAFDPESGLLLPWDAGVTGSGGVSALALKDSLLYVGGLFTAIGGAPRTNAGAVSVTTGVATFWQGSTDGGVRSIALSGNGQTVYLGGEFTTLMGAPRHNLGAIHNNSITNWNPDPNTSIYAVAMGDTVLYTCGTFNTIGGQSRAGLAALRAYPAPATATSFNPFGPLGSDFCLAYDGSSKLYVGGAGSGGSVGCIDVASSSVLSWPYVGPSVYGLSIYGDRVYAAGDFHLAGGQVQGGIAEMGLFFPPFCGSGGYTTAAGTAPRALAVGDFDGIGTREHLVANTEAPFGFTLVHTRVDGTFGSQSTFALPARPMHVLARDFDGNGYDDIAVSLEGNPGRVMVWYIADGALNPLPTITLEGRVDGLAAADVDQDGIVDLVACLTDSASTPYRGGLKVLRGGGSGGVWNQTFVPGPKLTAGTKAIARRVLIHDFNSDGIPDFAFTGSNANAPTILHMAPGLVTACIENAAVVNPPGSSGIALVGGDFDEDGRQDLALASSSRLVRVFRKNAVVNPACGAGNWFDNTVSLVVSPTARELAVLDYNQDGILDIACTSDSADAVLLLQGLGSGDFASAATLGAFDAWGLSVGDFLRTGEPQLALDQPGCGTLTILNPGATPALPMQITLIEPNGGEVWPQATVAPKGARGQLASSQTIAWSKTAGIRGVDVQVSRDNGASWQTIANDVPGTSMPWIVTPPATATARVRVRDRFAPVQDASDASFLVPGAATAVDPGLPLIAGLFFRGRHPDAGVLRFRLDVPAACDVEVVVFDVGGRIVQRLAHGRHAAGSHDLVWNPAESSRGSAPAGVYFVRANIGGAEVVRKTVRL